LRELTFSFNHSKGLGRKWTAWKQTAAE